MVVTDLRLGIILLVYYLDIKHYVQQVMIVIVYDIIWSAVSTRMPYIMSSTALQGWVAVGVSHDTQWQSMHSCHVDMSHLSLFILFIVRAVYNYIILSTNNIVNRPLARLNACKCVQCFLMTISCRP